MRFTSRSLNLEPKCMCYPLSKCMCVQEYWSLEHTHAHTHTHTHTHTHVVTQHEIHIVNKNPLSDNKIQKIHHTRASTYNSIELQRKQSTMISQHASGVRSFCHWDLVSDAQPATVAGGMAPDGQWSERASIQILWRADETNIPLDLSRALHTDQISRTTI